MPVQLDPLRVVHGEFKPNAKLIQESLERTTNRMLESVNATAGIDEYQLGMQMGMVVGAAIIAWADVIRWKARCVGGPGHHWKFSKDKTRYVCTGEGCLFTCSVD